jgi:Fe-S oxidoreductase
MRDFLKGHENALSDYHAEFTEHGRIGISGVFLDDLVLPTSAVGKIPFLQAFDKIIVFPGCLISARYPLLVHRLYQLLVLLGVDTRNIIVDDESCCGSFLHSIDDDEFMAAGAQLFKTLTKKTCKVLVITACGSCTSTLRDLQERLIDAGVPKKTAGNPGMTTIMHYAELLAMQDCIDVLKPLLDRLGSERIDSADGKKPVYVQFPCQVNANPASRARVIDGLNLLITAAGYEIAYAKHDLGCCGAGLLETHPDLAIEYGVRRMVNITDDSEIEVGTIAVACGNCHRILVDFRPALETECDCVETMGVDVRFLLDMLMELMFP